MGIQANRLDDFTRGLSQDDVCGEAPHRIEIFWILDHGQVGKGEGDGDEEEIRKRKLEN